MNIEQRKKDHVRLCADGKVAYVKSAGFDRFDFVHNSLSELNFSEISTKTALLGRTFSFPLFISSMTGGYAKAGAVNAVIARFCERFDIPFGVGSQRVMLENPDAAASFSVVREQAPNAFIASNIGGNQLVEGFTDEHLKLITDAIRADALIIHLNPLQELMQPEGDRNFRGILDGIKRVCDTSDIPVIVKETGAGINHQAALKLKEAGVRVIDVAGAGGTSWSKVENRRSGIEASLFDEWGIPTVDCLLDLNEDELDGIEIIASGGIRNAADIAKSLCLGAGFTAAAQPVIQAVLEGGEEALESLFNQWRQDLKIILCLLGAKNPGELEYQHIRTVF